MTKPLRLAVSRSSGDPFFGNVTMLLHGDGTNGAQNNTFADSGPNNLTITRNGNPTQGSFNPYQTLKNNSYTSSVYGGSGYFDGNDSFSFSDITFNSDFCAECWFYKTSNPTNYSVLFGGSSVGTPANNHQFSVGNDGSVGMVLGGSVVLSVGTAATINQWNHIAWVRNGSNCAIFVNGVRQGTATSSINNSICNRFGQLSNLAGYYPIGFVSDARIVVGSSVYDPTSSTITVPANPLTSISNTKLLLSFANAGIFDNSTSIDLETVGNAQISTSVKKFGTGSIVFDGTGDWLIAPHLQNQLFGTGNFTVEFFVYLSSVGSARGIIGKGTSTTGWEVSTDSSNRVVFAYGSSTITSVAALSASTWYHIAIVREGTGTNQTKIYINGTNDGTGTVNTDFTQTNAIVIGANRVAGNALNGYLDDIRITKGIARYTANFTPTALPFPDN